MVRILNGKKLKYTVRVSTKEEVFEFQRDYMPNIQFLSAMRCLWLVCKVAENSYDEVPIMKWPEDGVLLVEVNPE